MLEAAFAVLMEQGPGDFAVADVAARAGVHETSIYRRWGTKAALAVDACLLFAETALPNPDTGSLRTDLIALVRSVAKFLSSPQGRAMLALTSAYDPSSEAMRRRYWQERFGLAHAIFDRALARGEISGRADPIMLLEMLISPFYFRLLVTGEPIEDWPIDSTVDHLLSAYQESAPAGVTR